VSSALRAEGNEKDWDAEFQKMQKEAEERLEEKVAEMMSNIEKTGADGK
jgi:hypothetical protein